MIIAKCPLRFSLAGGSTDLQDFVDTNNFGSVISFPASVYTYISVHNNNRDKYIINYSKRETTQAAHEIKNDIAREVLVYFGCGPITMTFNTDIQTVGSGLASSSSYMVAAIGAVSKYMRKELSNFEIYKLALHLERKFNPLTGYQDPYGCGLPSLKKMVFRKGKDPEVTFLDQSLLSNLDMHIKYTGIQRQSTKILNKVVKSDRRALLDKVNSLENSIKTSSRDKFLNTISEGWEQKKTITPFILSNKNVKDLDYLLQEDCSVLSHRLCGAGNGGYFLIFSNKDEALSHNNLITIKINQKGLEVIEV